MIKKKNLVFLGPPGAGKGTLSGQLLEEYSLAHISTGDILRKEIANQTELGIQAKDFMDKGQLVPDEVVAGMVASRLMESDCGEGFILDGFPRTLNQGKLLEQALKKAGMELDAVIYFNAGDELLLQRLTARLNCKCGAVYNKLFMKPAKEGICDKCGDSLFQRPDDSLETAKDRLEVYYKLTEPLIEYYKVKGILSEIDSELPKAEAYAMLLERLN
ncbi:MAG: adenylate kinase [Victivallales bacterium]|nr:adenylate kinase [Victivallales bacterium]